MKSIASLLSIIALGAGLLSCSGGGGGGGGGSVVTFAITTTSAPFGVVGNAYSATLVTTGGTAPLIWTLFGGVLPNGLSLNGATGVVSGTPTAAGNFTATFTVKDSTGQTATGSVSFVVHPRTDRVSVDTNGSSVAGATNTEPSISRTAGRFIAFTSSGSTLVAGVGGQQIYVHDRQTGQPSLASKSSLGSAGISGVSSAASVSADGRFIVFASTATNLVPGVFGQQIYLHDTQTSATFPNGQTTLVSKNNSGTAGSGLSKTPTISNDGRFIAFASASSNLVTGISGTQIYRHDTQTSVAFPNGQTVPVSIDESGVAGVGVSTAPVIIDDGSVVAFVSTAPLVPGANAVSDIYVRALP